MQLRESLLPSRVETFMRQSEEDGGREGELEKERERLKLEMRLKEQQREGLKEEKRSFKREENKKTIGGMGSLKERGKEDNKI